MKSVHIRDLDPDTLAALKRMARSHHRSLQGELRAILEREARLAPDEPNVPIQLNLVNTRNPGTWSREEIYDDQGR